jgi:hypothetical protein
MTQSEYEAAKAFNEALQAGSRRAAAFDQALAVWRRSHPLHTEFRAVADLATALRSCRRAIASSGAAPLWLGRHTNVESQSTSVVEDAAVRVVTR